MMIIDRSLIVKYGSNILRQKAVDVVFPRTDLKQITMSMFMVMYKAAGVGLAANQVGLSENIAVIDIIGDEDKNHQVILINPRILSSSDPEDRQEGCLSLPGISKTIKRPHKISVETFDVDGNKQIINATGLLAVAIQHEMDHLEGKLFIDRLSSLEKTLLDGKLKQISREARREAKKK